MKKFVKKWWYILKYLKSNAIDEYNKKDNYRFRTNFDKKDIELYKSISKKLGIDYKIEDNATDCNGRRIDNCYAFYVHNYSDCSKFSDLYWIERNKQKKT